MADIKSEIERSENMSAIKRSNTKPELFIRKLLFSSGYRYRLQNNNVPGHPDLWLGKHNTAIFVHGCFWHHHNGCKYAYIPKSKVEFWENKFSKNRLRDQKVADELKTKGVKCLVIWECTINTAKRKNGDISSLLFDIENFLISDRDYYEL